MNQSRPCVQCPQCHVSPPFRHIKTLLFALSCIALLSSGWFKMNHSVVHSPLPATGWSHKEHGYTLINTVYLFLSSFTYSKKGSSKWDPCPSKSRNSMHSSWSRGEVAVQVFDNVPQYCAHYQPRLTTDCIHHNFLPITGAGQPMWIILIKSMTVSSILVVGLPFILLTHGCKPIIILPLPQSLLGWLHSKLHLYRHL